MALHNHLAPQLFWLANVTGTMRWHDALARCAELNFLMFSLSCNCCSPAILIFVKSVSMASHLASDGTHTLALQRSIRKAPT
jgi:hypothetical protein